MLKGNRSPRKWRMRCLIWGHDYYRVIWPGFGREPHQVWRCRECFVYDIRESGD